MRRVGLPVIAVVALAVALAGCVPTAATPTTSTKPTSTSTSTSAPAPTINLNGTANQNLAYFDEVNKKFIAQGGDLSGRPFIDNLVKAGFPKADMELTPDRTTVNLAADNISFSIRLGASCLIGQYGNTGYASTVQKLLSTSRCLVGTTRKIDW
ncbi:MAG: hypothetical protein ABJA11_07390 [Pseudolysinimonas sp.]